MSGQDLEKSPEDNNTQPDPPLNDGGTSETKKRRTMGTRSDVWDHYEAFVNDDNERKARCIHCKKEYFADSTANGTSSLIKHKKVCKKIPLGKQSELNLQPGTLGTWKFDQEAIRKALSQMVIIDELAFKFVENEGFQHFMSIVCPRFQIPSRWTVSRNCFQVYMDEKNLLKALLKSSDQRVCLTTDTWTSIQKLNYMCLTAHYIDKDWKLHKKIINFCTITRHRGKDIGWEIEKCLHEWGIEKIFTITVDNASSNDTAMIYLKDKMGDMLSSIRSCKHLHMRCVAHIINLVVTDGLKLIGSSVKRVRNVVRYVRQSPARLKKFKECCEHSKILSKSLLCLDVCTRWNSTYLMLDAAVKFEKAFYEFDLQDSNFRCELESGDTGGIPNKDDWLAARRMLGFLKVFYELTCRISGSSYVSSNMHLREIHMVHCVLKEWMMSGDRELVAMTKNMKIKFNKYWGDPKKMNMMIIIAAALDPRYKLEWVQFALSNMYGIDMSVTLVNDVKEEMFALYNEYKKPISAEHGNDESSILVPNAMDVDDPTVKAMMLAETEYLQFKSGKKRGIQSKTEVEKFFNEETEEGSSKFDILLWWKVNEPRFPVLSLVARDVLAIPISTVASESAFSAGSRVLDAFRSSLTPKVVQSLICGQDWLRRSTEEVNVEEKLDDVDKIEQGLRNIALEASTD